MVLYIKNMVCDRCKMVVKTEFERLGFNPIRVQLGLVEIKDQQLDQAQMNDIAHVLQSFGFDLLVDKKSQITAQIKGIIIELIHYTDEPIRVNLSTYLSEKLDLTYANLSAIFSEITHSTIEKYVIEQKIEKVKELLTYGEKSLSEIAYLLNYSSVAHLSTQFKKVSKQTPSEFKKQVYSGRKTLDQI